MGYLLQQSQNNNIQGYGQKEKLPLIWGWIQGSRGWSVVRRKRREWRHRIASTLYTRSQLQSNLYIRVNSIHVDFPTQHMLSYTKEYTFN